ncbi:MAG: asparagine synthase (glutamine-hydrolyzing) [Nitrospira sp.]|nr:asparagine synthase (glutamine-hydrolyzing) [Candidatus Manganitrophaceae bacterium]HIL35443.1 asparagine synthase (glutamine-hydrolyzing) [Candidatus Manganitrophaceae bacterium]
MCAIAGFLDLSRRMGRGELEEISLRMVDTLVHRGPDGRGVWVDPEAGISLGHRRLAVIDLSSEGHQPMLSACGRYVVVYNGEIYNFKSLRIELERLGDRFRGHSDTEVMLASIRRWGLKEALQRFNGMFAFALWDRQERQLYLVRDRLGEKPLYYGWSGNTFLFGSELKSLCAYPGFCGEINRDALALYYRHNYIPTPYSIYKDIYKLPPGEMLTLSFSDERFLPNPTPYWSFKEVAESGMQRPFEGTAEEAIDSLETLLMDSIKLRMESDVPLGVFLSGGIDSSTIAALMQVQSTRPVKTFTIGFYEQGYNEADRAKAIAQHLGTAHTELYVTPEEAMAIIPDLSTFYDEPFSDSSQIPTILVSKLARRHVTVSLSGDGGDELFSGYPRYFIGQRVCGKIGCIPRQWRGGIGRVLRRIGALPLLSSDRLQRLGEIMSVEEEEKMYREMVSHVTRPTDFVLGSSEPPTVFSDSRAWIDSPDLIHRMMYLDTRTYLPDDILAKVDRASMGVGLEARVPMLDHRLVAFAWTLPMSLKIHRGEGKQPLRKILGKYIPRKLFEHPKMGFGVPIDVWLRGPMREWAESLLDEKRLREEGILNPESIRTKWLEHRSEKRNHHYFLWNVLMFQAWLEKRNETGFSGKRVSILESNKIGHY